jgi:hypothetical protein
VTGPNLPKPASPAAPPAGAPVEVVSQFIALQTRQLEVRQQEIEVQRFAAETERKKVDNAQEYSLKALTAEVADRKDEREHESKSTRYGYRILLVSIIGAIALMGYALYANKDQLLLEAVKVLALAGGGGGVGFVLGFRKGRTTAQDEESSTGTA